jgi:FkbM family methyltransferase
MRYSIVVPTYNHCDDLLKPCLESIFKYSHMRDIELIISANGCVDNTKSYLAELQNHFQTLGMEDHFKIVWSDAPLGFSRATNAGIKAATCDLVVLFSNDVTLLSQNKGVWLARLAAAFDAHEDCGISCTNKMYSEHAGREFAIFFCVMIHKKVFEKIGLLNEDYGVGSGEDIEFSIETENAGFKVIEVADNTMDHNLKMWISDFPLYHKGEGTVHDPRLVPDWTNIFTRNMLKVAQKYNPTWIQTNKGQFPWQLVQETLPKFHKAINQLQTKNNVLFEEIFKINCYNVNQNEFDGATVVDIGAHMGTFSVFSLVHGARSVLAVEANPVVYDTHLKSVASSLPEITLVNTAVTDQDDLLVSILNDDVNSQLQPYNPKNLSVKTISLERLLAQHDVQGSELILKLDIEGHEFNVLLNTPIAVLNRFKTIFVEVHNNMNSNPSFQDIKKIAEHLENNGFKKTFEIPLLWFGIDGTVTQTGVWNEKYERLPV